MGLTFHTWLSSTWKPYSLCLDPTMPYGAHLLPYWHPSHLSWVLKAHSKLSGHSDTLSASHKPSQLPISCNAPLSLDTFKLQLPAWFTSQYCHSDYISQAPTPCVSPSHTPHAGGPFSHPTQDLTACARQASCGNVLLRCIGSDTAHWAAFHVEDLHT